MADNGQEVIVGEVEAGRAASVKRAIKKFIHGVNMYTFDLAELLYEMKHNQYFTAMISSPSLSSSRTSTG